MNAEPRNDGTTRIALSLFIGVSLALGLLWALVAYPSAEAQVIGPSHRDVLNAEAAAAADGLRPSTNGITEPHIVLTKNDDFYDAASVIITQGTSLFIGQGEAWTRYQEGELDTIAPPGPALETIKSSPTYSPQLEAFARPVVYYYGFSHDVEPFDDPQVRAAFASAIDRPRLIREVEALTGDEFPALTLTPPGNFGHVDGYSAGIGRPYSPTLAQDLLAASGYTGAPTITLMFNTSPHHQAIAEAARDVWIDT
ncbi:MAG: ABC transporter substrate-binding protein, partial [Anaerolineae bacterium]